MRHRGRYLAHDTCKYVIFRVSLRRIRSWLVGVDRIEQAALQSQLEDLEQKGIYGREPSSDLGPF